MSGSGVGYRSDLGIAVDRGRIVALGPARELHAQFTADNTIDSEQHVLLPGLVDVHMHTAMCLLRGLAQDTGHWMMYGIVPPAMAFQSAGGRVGLGSDRAPGNNNHNLFNEMKLTALLNKIRTRIQRQCRPGACCAWPPSKAPRRSVGTTKSARSRRASVPTSCSWICAVRRSRQSTPRPCATWRQISCTPRAETRWMPSSSMGRSWSNTATI
jgi:hypothetical protein